MSTIDDIPLREHLLLAVRKFVEAASALDGVERISLLGSLATEKQDPKDADVMVMIRKGVNLQLLASIGRKLKGAAQTRNAGADIFLCTTDGEYLGRTCSYRQCHIRVACRGMQCGRGTFLCDDLEEITLKKGIILEPPVDLWPEVVKRSKQPEDVESLLCVE